MRRAGRIVALIVDVFEAVLQTAGIQVSDVCAAQRFRLKADGRLAPAQLCPRTQDQHATTQIRQCIISLCGTTDPRHKHTKRTPKTPSTCRDTQRAHINSTRLPAAYWQDHNNSAPVCRCIYRKCVCVCVFFGAKRLVGLCETVLHHTYGTDAVNESAHVATIAYQRIVIQSYVQNAMHLCG